MAKFTEERQFILNNYNNILSLLGRSFDSGDFIETFRRLYPTEYASVLARHNSYSNLHTWIARWILTELMKRNFIVKNDKQSRTSINRNITKNQTWTKAK